MNKNTPKILKLKSSLRLEKRSEKIKINRNFTAGVYNDDVSAQEKFNCCSNAFRRHTMNNLCVKVSENNLL